MRNLDCSIFGLFYAHLLFGIASLIFGRYALWEDGQYVFVGLSVAKNAYGGVNFFIVMLGVYVAHVGLAKGRRSDIALGLFSIFIGFTGVLVSKSTGALMSVVAAVAIYFSFALLSKFKTQIRVQFLLFIAIFTAILVGISIPFWNDILSVSLNYFGKSSDLTGRVDLWVAASKLVDRNFWLGVGQFAFWVQGDPLPEAIWAANGIEGRLGFNFHNTYYEIMVHLGIIGLLIHLIVFGILISRQFKYAIFTSSKEHYFYFCILGSFIGRIPYESVLPLSPIYPITVFTVASLALRPPISKRSRDFRYRGSANTPYGEGDAERPYEHGDAILADQRSLERAHRTRYQN